MIPHKTRSGAQMDLQNLKDRADKHSKSDAHLNSTAHLSAFGKINIVAQISRGHRLSVEEHN